MRNIVFTLLVLLCAVSCSTYTKLTYLGQATYYLPDGEKETFDAKYTETFFNGIKNGENLSVDVGEGNVFIFSGIPYTFKGHITKGNGASVGEDYSMLNLNEKNGFYEFFYNGANYDIPVSVYNELKYKSNGNAERLNRLLIEYISK